MALSERLEKIIETVPECGSAADIGCDHGYVAIELVRRKKAAKLTAADINKGPLSAAKKNIEAAGLYESIKTALSDGVRDIGIPDCLIISGMGGRLITDILRMKPSKGDTKHIPDIKEARERLSACKYLVLSPQSELEEVRRFLINELFFNIEDEKMVKDDGKFYVVIRAVNTAGEENVNSSYQCESDFIYGKKLIEKKDAVFKEYLSEKLKKTERIIERLSYNIKSEKAKSRLGTVKSEAEEMRGILEKL